MTRVFALHGDRDLIDEEAENMNEKDLCALTLSPESEQVFEKMRRDMGIKTVEKMNPSSPDGRIERVKISDAAFFPDPPSFWNRCSPAVYRLLAKDADDYIRVWIYKGLRVMCSPARYDGVEWLHISFSRPNRMPDYDDIQLVKNNFIGDDRKAIMVFPEKDHYVNIHKYCLHLWQSEDNPLPDFDEFVPGLGPSI